MQKFKIIAISGVGRAGKDSFFRFASEYLNSQGVTTGRWAFADELKRDMDDFIQEKFGFSAFTENTDEKSKVRPLLVEYGRIRRNDSRGQHWLKTIEPSILAEEGPQVRFITDLRFAKYGETDELNFIKKNGGSVIHIQRYSVHGFVQEPANKEEEVNDPLIRWAADLRFQWTDWECFDGGEKMARAEVERVMSENKQMWEI